MSRAQWPPIRRLGYLLVLLAVSAGCAGSSHRPASTAASRAATLLVPAQYPTIQAAVSHAHAGDLVLISPGIYHESVTITVPDLDLRGLNRNTVILDGGDTMANGIAASANGDVVENVTVRHFAINGVLFTAAGTGGPAGTATTYGTATDALQGYRASYVTAYDNGLYGIYAFAARDGQIDHAYASGQPDSGIYVGQCDPCNAVVNTAVGQGNRVGFEAANASSIAVVNSTWTANRAGITIESTTDERLAPQHGALVAGNVVTNNGNSQTPTQAQETNVFGYGIVIGGGADDVVMANRVTGNPTVGILVSDLDGYEPMRDTVEHNATGGNGTDLALTSGKGGPLAVAGTCFVGNTLATSLPAMIEAVLPCGHGPASITVAPLGQSVPPPGVDYLTLPPPPAQVSMPDASTAPPVAVEGLGAAPEASTITLPPA